MITIELAGDFQQRHFAATPTEMWQIIGYYQNEFSKARMTWKRVSKNQINAIKHDGTSVQMTWTDDRFEA